MSHRECPECDLYITEDFTLKVCERHDRLYCGRYDCCCCRCKKEEEKIILEIDSAIRANGDR